MTAITSESLTDMQLKIRGEALTPSDPGYQDGRVPFNAMHADRPDLVVRCSGTADVVEAVNFARENGMEVTVRGGGHSVAGLSSADGGMVIDLSLMRAVDVDPERESRVSRAVRRSATSTGRRRSSAWPRRWVPSRRRVSPG